MSSPAITESARPSGAFLSSTLMSSCISTPRIGSQFELSAAGSAFTTQPSALLSTTAKTVLPSVASLTSDQWISTIATTATATNIPGENGLDTCVLYTPGDPSNPDLCPGTSYCQCGNVGVAPAYVPTVTTMTGTAIISSVPVCSHINTQPTANACPLNSASILSASAASASAASVSSYIQPTASSKCFPYHDYNDLAYAQPNIDFHCEGSISDDVVKLSQANTSYDPKLLTNENEIWTRFQPASDAPAGCQERTSLACLILLKQIVIDCPYNGGDISDRCGSWWLMTCPLHTLCPAGCPGGNFEVGDPRCGDTWPPA